MKELICGGEATGIFLKSLIIVLVDLNILFLTFNFAPNMPGSKAMVCLLIGVGGASGI